MKRIVIFGLPGSGKSTFAHRLGKILNIPVHHLDRLFFVAKWEARKTEEFLALKENVLKEDSWIIEGNSIKTLERRFAKADVAIYFCLPRYLCLWRVFKRRFFPDRELADTPTGCAKSARWILLKYLWTFDKEKRASIEELKQKYPHVQFYLFRKPKDAETFLESVRSKDF
jgi:adenylate kinase family enzyme